MTNVYINFIKETNDPSLKSPRTLATPHTAKSDMSDQFFSELFEEERHNYELQKEQDTVLRK